MKVILTEDEVKQILLGFVCDRFGTDFDSVEFDGYGYGTFRTATLEVAEKPKVEEAPVFATEKDAL